MEYFLHQVIAELPWNKMVGHQNEKSHVKTFTIRIHITI